MFTTEWTQPKPLVHLLSQLMAGDTSCLPPSAPGNYRVDLPDAPMLYFGGTNNLLNRIGDLKRDILGYYGRVVSGMGWVGRHSGGQSLHAWCVANGINIGHVLLSWTPATDVCTWCVEAHILQTRRPQLSGQRGRRKCCCPR